ncbi:ubiquitin-like domain-containing protein [Lentibacillus sp. N15]|uniref:ubiquitin-like domain-containing protein n=1 Tax=Lentibacillus songyuanensis TaxID=3136161 RepID=UPI0031BA67CA
MEIISKLMPASKWKLVISSIGVVALAVFSSLLLIEAQKSEVDITEDGEQRTVSTHANTVEELLNEEGITVSAHDELSADPNTELKDGMEITLNHAKRITVLMDGEEQEFYTMMQTVGAFLDKPKNGLSVSKHDELSFNRGDELKDGMQLTIDKAFQITVNDGGKKKKYWTTGVTVADFLEDNEITYEEDSKDRIKPKPGDQITKDTKIAITRIEKLPNIVLEEEIPFETETQKDNTLAKGEEKVLEDGENGIRELTYKAFKKNGKKKKGKLIDSEVTTDSQNKIIAIGTKEPDPKPKPKKNAEPNVVNTSSSNNNANSDVLYMTATAFTADCSGCSGHTATGIDLQANPNAKVIAVDPSIIPLGSKVWVEGYGNAIAADTGGFSGKQIDLHVPTKADAYSFGRKQVKVKILN